MPVCVHMSRCVSACTFVHICMCVLSMNVHICRHINICAFVHVYKYAYGYDYVCVYMYMHECVCVRMHVCVSMCRTKIDISVLFLLSNLLFFQIGSLTEIRFYQLARLAGQ